MLTRLQNYFNNMHGYNNNDNVNNCIKKLSNNARINSESFERYNYLCMVLNNMQITDNITLADENLTELMHMFFSNNSIVAEIYKHLRSKGLIFLHKIYIRVHSLGGMIEYLIRENAGYEDYDDPSKQQVSFLDPDLYYATQINPVIHEKIMALPIGFVIEDEDVSHENMLIISRDNGQLIIEHFEPMGHMFYQHPIYDEIRILVKILFGPEVSESSKIHFIEINKICPLQILQRNITGKFIGSCTTFSIWYALLRLLNPEKPYWQTYEDMEKYLLKTSNPNAVIKNIVGAFIRLINLRSDGSMGENLESRRRISLNNLKPFEVQSERGGAINKKKFKWNKNNKIKSAKNKKRMNVKNKNVMKSMKNKNKLKNMKSKTLLKK